VGVGWRGGLKVRGGGVDSRRVRRRKEENMDCGREGSRGSG